MNGPVPPVSLPHHLLPSFHVHLHAIEHHAGGVGSALQAADHQDRPIGIAHPLCQCLYPTGVACDDPNAAVSQHVRGECEQLIFEHLSTRKKSAMNTELLQRECIDLTEWASAHGAGSCSQCKTVDFNYGLSTSCQSCGASMPRHVQRGLPGYAVGLIHKFINDFNTYDAAEVSAYFNPMLDEMLGGQSTLSRERFLSLQNLLIRCPHIIGIDPLFFYSFKDGAFHINQQEMTENTYAGALAIFAAVVGMISIIVTQHEIMNVLR